MEEIIELDIKNFEKCSNIWNMEKNKELKNRFYNELLNKTRKTFVYVTDEEFEIFIDYHLKNCNRKDLIGYSSHVLKIIEKL